MSTELVNILNVLIKGIELAQSKGAYRLSEAQVLADAISKLTNLLNPKKQELDTIIEDTDEDKMEQINI